MVHFLFLDDPGSSETDFNDAGEGPGQDVAGVADSPSMAGLAGQAAGAGSPLSDHGDAGPFNIAGYQRRLPPGVRDAKYG